MVGQSINQMNILVSVVVPTYKRSDIYLERCINSLLDQTYSKIEIIVVDDNINGDKYNLATEAYMNVYSNVENVKYIKTHSNIGPALSRNLGIENSKGQYITFLDDDDIYLPDKVKTQLLYMLDNDLDMSFTDLILKNTHGKLIDYRKHDYVKSLNNKDLIKLHVLHNLTSTPTYMFKASSLDNINHFDNSILSEEYYLMEKAINSGLKIGYLPQSHVIAYRHKMGGESFGTKKIIGEKLLYQSKKKYFDILSKKQIRFTRCRYFAVMAVSYFRAHKYFAALAYSMLTFIVSPYIVIKEIKKKNKILKEWRLYND